MPLWPSIQSLPFRVLIAIQPVSRSTWCGMQASFIGFKLAKAYWQYYTVRQNRSHSMKLWFKITISSFSDISVKSHAAVSSLVLPYHSVRTGENRTINWLGYPDYSVSPLYKIGFPRLTRPSIQKRWTTFVLVTLAMLSLLNFFEKMVISSFCLVSLALGSGYVQRKC